MHLADAFIQSDLVYTYFFFVSIYLVQLPQVWKNMIFNHLHSIIKYRIH